MQLKFCGTLDLITKLILMTIYDFNGFFKDFGDDDTPLYQLSSNVMGSLFQQATRNKRQAVYNIMEPLKTEPGMDESSLKQLVHKFSQETGTEIIYKCFKIADAVY